MKFTLALIFLVGVAVSEVVGKRHAPAKVINPVQFYDWQQWISKLKDKTSSSSAVSKGSKTSGGYDWKQWLSNSYGEIPSGIQEEYSFSPFDWQKFLSNNQAAAVQGVDNYDWQKWLSKSDGGSGYDWKKWLSQSEYPVQFYQQKPRPSKTGGKTKKPKVSKSQNFNKGGYDWKQWLSKSNSAKDQDSLSESNNKGKSGKGSFGGYDWRKWLSKSSKSEVGSGVNSNVDKTSQLSKSSGKGSKGGNGGYDWQQWLSKYRKSEKSDSSVVSSVSGNSQVSKSVGSNSKSGNGGYDWKQWLSNSGDGGYDWKIWLSKSQEQSTSSDDTSAESPVESNSNNDGTYDWKSWLSNSFGEIPSGLESKYSFSKFDWTKFLSQGKSE